MTPSAQALPEPGDLVAGRYRVERLVGRGSTGVVLAARVEDRASPHEEVALKVLRPELLASRDAVERFVREASAASALTSAHVAKVFEVVDDAVIVMELLDGENLAQSIDRGAPLQIAAAAEYVAQAASAIADAHRHGIIHRDVKPSNLFLTRDLTIKVLDFGIAKVVHDASAPQTGALTATGAILGSPGYWSPEQVRDSKSVDERADVWGLGATLFALVSGEPPFFAPSLMALCAKVLSADALPLAALRDDVPDALSDLVARCLSKTPEARPTVGELIASLAILKRACRA